ncbi:MAG: hypothetical protein H6667_03985 [Ardenticatenaceae bacterium]|nr:hypothetical protein [Ardenticatenaceae bacterium]MCB9446632.1 hypothetical protein [Ardenticatenaceae bacterium]
MFIFGFLAFVLGLVGLKSPKALLKQMGFTAVDPQERAEHDYTHVFVMSSSMASTNMGIYYMLAALLNVRRFFYWTVPFRVVTFSVFATAVAKGRAPVKFLMVAVWELVGALLTGWALWAEEKGKKGETAVS